MKYTLLSFLLISSIFVFSQTKRIEILKEEIGPLSIKYVKSINLDKGDSLYFVYIGFQNAKYTSITDIKSLGFSKDNIFKQFLKDLNIALEEMEKNQKVNLDWDRSPDYKLNLYDFNSNNLYVVQGAGTGGYTIISKKQVSELIKILARIERIGNENLLN